MPRLEMLKTAPDCAENNWTKWGNTLEKGQSEGAHWRKDMDLWSADCANL